MGKHHRPLRWMLGALLALALWLGFASSAWALTTVLHETFETYTVGPLGAPWSVTKSGSSHADIVSTTTGKHLLFHGGTADADYMLVRRDFSSSAPEIVVAADMNPAAGGSFVWELHGAGSSIGARRIRLQRLVGSTMLSSQTVPGGTRDCAPLPSGVWSRVTLKVHATVYPHTFDVLINGNPTACKALSTGLSPTFTYIAIMDIASAGYGGNIRFDNIDLTTP